MPSRLKGTFSPLPSPSLTVLGSILLSIIVRPREVAAQWNPAYPPCVMPCLDYYDNLVCNGNRADFSCICGNAQFQGGVALCARYECGDAVGNNPISTTEALAQIYLTLQYDDCYKQTGSDILILGEDAFRASAGILSNSQELPLSTTVTVELASTTFTIEPSQAAKEKGGGSTTANSAPTTTVSSGSFTTTSSTSTSDPAQSAGSSGNNSSGGNSGQDGGGGGLSTASTIATIISSLVGVVVVVLTAYYTNRWAKRNYNVNVINLLLNRIKGIKDGERKSENIKIGQDPEANLEQTVNNMMAEIGHGRVTHTW